MNALGDLCPALKRIFWLVHPIKSWDPNHSDPTTILVSAPLHDWREVARLIQTGVKPEAWKMERLGQSGENNPATILIPLRKYQHTYQIQVLPLRAFKSACFYYDHQRGHYLARLIKLPARTLQLQPTGLFWEARLALAQPTQIRKFFGLNGSRPEQQIRSTPADLYSEIAASPFFDPEHFFSRQPEEHPVQSEGFKEFDAWWQANKPATKCEPLHLTPKQIKDRIDCISLED